MNLNKGDIYSKSFPFPCIYSVRNEGSASVAVTSFSENAVSSTVTATEEGATTTRKQTATILETVIRTFIEFTKLGATGKLFSIPLQAFTTVQDNAFDRCKSFSTFCVREKEPQLISV